LSETAPPSFQRSSVESSWLPFLLAYAPRAGLDPDDSPAPCLLPGTTRSRLPPCERARGFSIPVIIRAIRGIFPSAPRPDWKKAKATRISPMFTDRIVAPFFLHESSRLTAGIFRAGYNTTPERPGGTIMRDRFCPHRLMTGKTGQHAETPDGIATAVPCREGSGL
jgi:hypothetical protein